MPSNRLFWILDSIDEDLLVYLDHNGELSPEAAIRIRAGCDCLLSGEIDLDGLTQAWPHWGTLTGAFATFLGDEETADAIIAVLAHHEEESTDLVPEGDLTVAATKIRRLVDEYLALQRALARQSRPWPPDLQDFVDAEGQLDVRAARRVHDLANELAEDQTTVGDICRRWPIWPDLVRAFVDHYAVDALKAAAAVSDPLARERDFAEPPTALDRQFAVTLTFWLQQYMDCRHYLPGEPFDGAEPPRGTSAAVEDVVASWSEGDDEGDILT